MSDHDRDIIIRQFSQSVRFENVPELRKTATKLSEIVFAKSYLKNPILVVIFSDYTENQYRYL